MIKIKYDTSVVVLPGRVTEVMNRASMVDLKVMVALCANPTLCTRYGEEGWTSLVAEAADCESSLAEAAIAFWRGAGIIDIKADKPRKSDKKKAVAEADAEAVPPPPAEAPKAAEAVEAQITPPAKTKPAPQNELPRYTTDQLAALLEERKETADFLHECQRIWGKIFNTMEVNIILGLVDYLGLEWDYVLSLLAYCAGTQERRGIHKSMRYVETTAFGFYDEGIRDISALNEKIRRMELMAEAEGKLRTLFGMGSRALTPKEKKCFSTWLYDYQYGIDMIRVAYDVTVDAKGTPNISYMNSVLSNWNRDGIRTPEEVQTAQEAHKRAQATDGKSKSKGKGTVPATGHEASSFDTDDFFAAAVRRNFGEDFDGTANPD